MPAVRDPLPRLLCALAVLLSATGCGEGSAGERASDPVGQAAPAEAPPETAARERPLRLPEPVRRDLPEIREGGNLTMLTMTNATSYFITSWDDVSYWLLQKSKREVYTDPVVYFGFVRGLEPVTYVAFILERYRHN